MDWTIHGIRRLVGEDADEYFNDILTDILLHFIGS